MLKLFIIAFAAAAFNQLCAQEAPLHEPEALTSLRESWVQADRRDLRPVKLNYLNALQVLKEELTKKGNTAGAILVRDEIEVLTGVAKRGAGDIWSLVPLAALRSDYERDTKLVTDANKEKYMRALKGLKRRFSKAGALERVLAIDKELSSLTTQMKGVRGRYVRVELPRDRAVLSLAEVQVFSGGENIAQNGKATQSSTHHSASAEKAIDGNTNGKYFAGSTTHTTMEEAGPWWELDLGEEKALSEVIIWNRTDAGGERLDRFQLSVLDGTRKAVWTKTFPNAPKRDLAIDLSSPSGR